MIWATVSVLIAVTAAPGKTAETSSAAIQAAALDIAAAAAAVSESVLWSFGASGDGVSPFAGLIADKSGNLYGTTVGGGANNEGTVFELSPPAGKAKQWSESVLWSFGASGDGGNPEAGLIADKSGNLYGTAVGGGANNEGTVFELSPPAGKAKQWSESVLWSFGASGDGAEPRADLIADTSGNLYGTTISGGANCSEGGCGTVFELSPPKGEHMQWSESVLWSFGASGDGSQPFAGLIANKLGNLYGTTDLGGNTNAGTVFELSPPQGEHMQWNETVRWSFGASGDGAEPRAGLIINKSGNLYGTTIFGGANYCTTIGQGCGTVFELSPPAGKSAQWRETVLWSFGTSGDGAQPLADLLADKSGNLYGTTIGGGANGLVGGANGIDGGTVFELQSALGHSLY